MLKMGHCLICVLTDKTEKMIGVSYRVHFQQSCRRLTMLLVILTVLCSNLCFVHTLPIVPSNTFNTAQTTVTTATVGNTASLKPGSSSATVRNKVASTSTVSSSTSTTSNGMSTLKPDHGNDRTSIALMNNIQQTNKTNKPYVQETGSTLGANAALRTGTQTSTRSTLVPSSASTPTPTSTPVAANSTTTATTTTKDSKAINVIHGAAALTSRKESRAQKINCKLLRKSLNAPLFSNGLMGDNHMSGVINVVPGSCPFFLTYLTTVDIYVGEVGRYPISVEMGHVCLNGTERRTVSGESFLNENFYGDPTSKHFVDDKTNVDIHMICLQNNA